MKKVLFLFFCLIAVSVSAKKVSTDYRNALIFGYSPVNSVYEDENIKLEIYDEQLWATNKTGKTIFIDYSQCFLVNNGSSYPMWSEEQDEKKSSKHGVTTETSTYLTIAPSTGSKQIATFICRMSTQIQREYSSTESVTEDFTEYDKRLLTLINELVTESLQADPKRKEYLGSASRHLTEDESISNIGASIAYAFSKKTEDWTTVSISTWVSDVIFAPYYVEMPDELSRKEKRGFGVKETSPAIVHVKADMPYDFIEDKSPIMVFDWKGAIKKGTFTLETTRILKQKKAMKVYTSIMSFGNKAYKRMLLSLLDALNDSYYKSVIGFDGTQSDWGKMSYAPTPAQTKRSE